MKICLINNLYDPYTKGGAETVVKATANGLVKNGHTVMIITAGKKDETIGQEIKIYRVKAWNIFSFFDIDKKPAFLRLIWWFFNIFNFSATKKIEKILQQEHPDLVHTHNLSGLSFLLPRSIKKLKIKHIHTLHDIQLAYPSGQLIYGQEKNFINTFFLRIGYEKIVRVLFGSPQIVISPSRWLLDFYLKKDFFTHSQKELVLNPSIEIFNNQPGLSKTKADEFNFLYVGRVEEYKGIMVLIQALKKLPLDGKKVFLHIAGTGRDMKKVYTLAAESENIFFYGQLEHERLTDLYRQAQFLVLPTLTYENSPMVIVEAFNHGLPVIASNLGGIIEMIQENKTGFLFKPGDIESLVKIMSHVLKGDNLNDLSQNCWQRAKKYSLNIYIKKLEEIYLS